MCVCSHVIFCKHLILNQQKYNGVRSLYQLTPLNEDATTLGSLNISTRESKKVPLDINLETTFRNVSNVTNITIQTRPRVTNQLLVTLN